MSAREHWEKEKPKFSEKLADCQKLDDAKCLYSDWLSSRLKFLVMSEQSNTLLRQQVGILLDGEIRACDLLNTVGESVVWQETTDASIGSAQTASGTHIDFTSVNASTLARWLLERMTRQNTIYLLLGGAILACVFEKALLGLILTGGALANQILRNRSAPRAEKQTSPQYRQVQKIDAAKLLRHIDQQMYSIDRHIEELTQLNSQFQPQTGAADKAQLALYQRLWELCSHPGNNPTGDCIAECEDMLSQSDLKFVLYDSAHANYFGLLPTKDETCTLYPAICNANDNSLVVMGKALINR